MLRSPAILLVVVLLLATLALPLVWGTVMDRAQPGPADDGDGAARRLVIVSPHNEQIRLEFARAFDAWHRREYGEPVTIDWRNLGGTGDILRVLRSRYRKLAEAGREEEGVGYDMMFGGGSYEFANSVKRGIEVAGPDGGVRTLSLSQPVTAAEIGEDLLHAALPTHEMVGDPFGLYDPQGHWYGVVLSSFGIAYNRDTLKLLGAPTPTTWRDLADARFDRWLALADPSHSGSVKVTYNAILQYEGFDAGLAMMRRAFANARYFAPSSTKVPVDISQGEAAAGICIDFYGRYQAEHVGAGRIVDGARCGFVAPRGATLVSADPIAVLRGATHRETAVRFIRFLLTTEGQAVWCFPKRTGADEMGPAQFELRRSPIRRDMYTPELMARMSDPVNPFEIAAPVPAGARNYMGVIPPVLHAMCMDTHRDLSAAWRALYRTERQLVRHRVADEVLSPEQQAELDALESRYAAMLAEFDKLPFTIDQLFAAKQAWKADPRQKDRDRIAWTAFFKGQYRKVVELAEQ